MMRRSFFFLVLVHSMPAAADPVPMSGADLSSVLPGALLALDTPLGTTIPLRFGTDGIVSGDAGALGVVLGATRDRGRWRVSGDRLCLKFFRWFDAKDRCMTVAMDGARVAWNEESGESGTATLLEQAPSTTVAAAPRIEALAPLPPAPVPSARNPEQSIETTAEPKDRIAFAKAAHASGLLRVPSPAKKPANRARSGNAPSETRSGSKPAVTAAAPKPKPASKTAAAKPSAPSATVAGQDLTPTATIKPTFRVARVDILDVLNVRSGPSEYHTRVGEIPPVARGVRIVGPCEGEWCPIRHERTRGWVNSYYLAEDAPDRIWRARSDR